MACQLTCLDSEVNYGPETQKGLIKLYKQNDIFRSKIKTVLKIFLINQNLHWSIAQDQ